MENLISIIVRTKNEERWIESCIQKIQSQKKVNTEIVIVDNNSQDKTLDICKKFKVKIIKIKNFFPGLAINMGVKKSKGNVIVCLSAHCVPCDDYWLYNLIKNLNKKKKYVAVYGRQVPLPYSSDFDKRDLLNTFGLEKRIQSKDSFFHNANSAFLKSIWEKYPFDDKLTNIEDRVWAHKIIKYGYKIVYEPKAKVFHWHGIHQDMDKSRCGKIVKILENLDFNYSTKHYQKLTDLKVSLIIPQKVDNKPFHERQNLIRNTIELGKRCKYIKNIIVSSDDKKIINFSKKLGCITIGPRPSYLSEKHIDLLTVCKHTLSEMEKKKIFSDYIVVASDNYPFREIFFFDNLISKMHKNNYECIVAAKEQKGTLWILGNKNKKKLDETNIPSALKDKKFYLSFYSYGFIVRPSNIRTVSIDDKKTGFLKTKNSFSLLDYKDSEKINKYTRRKIII
jgi:rhamnosyltransferase